MAHPRSDIPGCAQAAASLYLGEVMHARLKPMAHRFTYQVLSLFIDLDRLDEADRLSPMFGVNRPAPFSFWESDHGPCDGSSLRGHAGRLLKENGLDLGQGRVLLLCYPRVVGYVFNPLSVYYCYGQDGKLVGLIYEVRNTFGEIHSYVRPVLKTEISDAGVRQSQAKAFFVSPFIGMDMRYHFRLTPPGEQLKLRILETDADGPLLAATFSGERRALTTRQLLSSLIRLPLVTAKIIGGIHYEALRLWLKGAPFYPRPHHALAPTRSEHGE